MHYTYRSPVGLMEIVPAPDGRWWLIIDGERVGSYHRPEGAADDVYCQATGHHGWDALPNQLEPCDLSEWTLSH